MWLNTTPRGPPLGRRLLLDGLRILLFLRLGLHLGQRLIVAAVVVAALALLALFGRLFLGLPFGLLSPSFGTSFHVCPVVLGHSLLGLPFPCSLLPCQYWYSHHPFAVVLVLLLVW